MSVSQVPVGSSPVLQCTSNNEHTNFLFWLINNNDIVGPGNYYDESKMKYYVLSGNLSIHDVGPENAGIYKCISQRVNDSAHFATDVELIVNSSFQVLDAIKLICIVISIIVIIGCGVMYMRLKRDWDKYDGRAVIPVEDDDAEDADGEEVYNPTTTTISAPVAGPSRVPSSEHLLYGIDNQGLDTDFNSVFENIQIKKPNQSLI